MRTCWILVLVSFDCVFLCDPGDDRRYVYYDAHNAPFRYDMMNINAQHYLEQNGYVVIKNIFQNEQELEYANKLLWKYLTGVGWKQHDPSTWNDFPGYNSNGIVFKHGIGQSELQWFIRTRPKLIDTFYSLWNLTDSVSHSDLITSFDGIGIFRPWQYDSTWETFDDWYHIDQNIVRKPYLDCIQGLVSLTDQNNESGSTVIIPKSHLFTSEYLADTMTENDHNFQLVDENKLDGLFKEPYNLKPLFVSTMKGDLLLWNAKVIHCNAPSFIEECGFEPEENECEVLGDGNIDLLRVVSYVCFTPKEKATEAAISKRIRGFEHGLTSNHNPHEPSLYAPHTNRPLYEANDKLDIKLIRKLVGYPN